MKLLDAIRNMFVPKTTSRVEYRIGTMTAEERAHLDAAFAHADAMMTEIFAAVPKYRKTDK